MYDYIFPNIIYCHNCILYPIVRIVSRSGSGNYMHIFSDIRKRSTFKWKSHIHCLITAREYVPTNVYNIYITGYWVSYYILGYKESFIWIYIYASTCLTTFKYDVYLLWDLQDVILRCFMYLGLGCYRKLAYLKGTLACTRWKHVEIRNQTSKHKTFTARKTCYSFLILNIVVHSIVVQKRNVTSSVLGVNYLYI